KEPDWPSYCDTDSTRRGRQVFPNADKHFSFHEDITQAVGTYGTITVEPAPETQREPIAVDTFYAMSGPLALGNIVTRKEDTSMSLDSLQLEESTSGFEKSRCIHIAATIYLHHSIRLETLNITTKHLSVLLANFPTADDSSPVLVSNSTTISLTHGSLTAVPFLRSRRTVIHSGTDSIYGTYPLYDLLSVSSSTGSINIDITPQAALPSSPAPAILEISSNTGSITAHYPPLTFTSPIPSREYRTSVTGGTSTTSGTFLHGHDTSLSTRTGAITASLLPYAADEYASSLSVVTSTGQQRVTVLPPYKKGTGKEGGRIKRMTSHHSSRTASMDLAYPQEWVGDIEAETGTGSLVVRGKNVEVVEEGGKWGGKFVRGFKGEGEHRVSGGVEVRGGTGSVVLNVGDLY
ncbi:hypothetical protein LTS18_009208, partial [Coniosporium uncinatum]